MEKTLTKCTSVVLEAYNVGPVCCVVCGVPVPLGSFDSVTEVVGRDKSAIPFRVRV